MHSWNRSCTGCWPRPGSVPGARYSMHCTGQNSGHFPHGQQRFTSMNATSRGRFFFSPSSSGTSGTRSSFSRRLMTSIADMARWWRARDGDAILLHAVRRSPSALQIGVDRRAIRGGKHVIVHEHLADVPEELVALIEPVAEEVE